MADKARTEELKKAFKSCDTAGDGRLSFNEFVALLKKGNPAFQDGQAEALFTACDQDMSGYVELDEFIDFIFDNNAMNTVFKLEANADEEECKAALLSKPGPIRAAASKAVKSRGDNWGKMTWKERLDEVLELEKGESEHNETRTKCAPALDATSTMTAPKRRADRKITCPSTKSPKKEKEPTRPSTQDRRSAAKQANASAVATSMPKGIAMGKFAIAEMGQAQLVDYSLQADDLSFAGDNAEAKQQCRDFKNHLKTAGSPLDKLNIIKFIAKGTAGWVFLCEDKDSGSRCAMKLIRMTQSRSGIKEWFCSKVLRKVIASAEAGVESASIVFTDEEVAVVQRSNAPSVIRDQLENAGPVNFFLAMKQELMPWGTLEDLAKEGELSPEIMFKCLEDVARTLSIMHSNGLQHRDVKPENIMLQMDEEDTVVEAKLCDFGSAQIGNEENSRWDDIRRFGVTMFSVATGEGWTKNRLIREKHENLVSRLKAAVEGCEDPNMKRLPEVLEKILGGSMKMQDVAEQMQQMADNYED